MATRDQHNMGGTELSRFLRARRARLTPEEVGLRTGAGVRRTPGLRREEVATLAGISIDYYIRLERGKETNPSPSVVDSLARTLKLDADEHEHLRLVAWRASRIPAEAKTAPSRHVSATTRLLLESLRPFPAHVTTLTGDLLAWNAGGLRLFPGIEKYPVGKRNGPRFVFLDPAARALYPNWEGQLKGAVAHLRTLAGKDSDDPALAQLVGELLVKSPEFASLWERYDIGTHAAGTKTFTHPEVGRFTVSYQTMELEGTPGHTVSVYLAEPGTPDHDALVLLDQLADLAPSSEPQDQDQELSPGS